MMLILGDESQGQIERERERERERDDMEKGNLPILDVVL
jgi:hypothetical protein